MKSKLFLSAVLVAAAMLTGDATLAAGFGAGISPPKFELRAKPGATLRDVLTILNASDEPAEYSLRTADWQLNDTQGVDYIEDELLDGSCRPWVKLERRSLKIMGGGQKRYRFEVHVPEDAPAGLCKFAILIEPGDTAMASIGENGEIKFPVVGRYAVTVYVTIGDAKPDIEFLGLGEQQIGTIRLPTMQFRNNGSTYDRAFGQVTATDAAGTRHTLVASTFPVLPGRTENILLALENNPNQSDIVVLEFPLTLKGRIQIGGQTFKIEAEAWGSD
jgi:fimbrial chaperone protein